MVCRFCNRPQPVQLSPAAVARNKNVARGILVGLGLLLLFVLGLVFAASMVAPPSRLGSQSTAASRDGTTVAGVSSGTVIVGDPQRGAVAAGPSAAPQAHTEPPPPAYQLALMASRGYDADYGYHCVEGRVQNTSGQPLHNVTAVASWFDDNGEFITSDSALIEYNPILPGQISPFKTMTRTNPAMKRFTVEFKFLMGASIATDDETARTRRPRR